MLRAETKSFLKSLTKLNPFFAGSKRLISADVLGGNGWGLSETLLPGLETCGPVPISVRAAVASATFAPGLPAPDLAAVPGGSGCGLRV